MGNKQTNKQQTNEKKPVNPARKNKQTNKQTKKLKMKVVAIALCILALVACANADCYDAVKNGDETSADCGGNTCWTRCSVGDACLVDSDCESQSCASGACAVPDE